MSDEHVAKKAKPTSSTPLYSELDLAKELAIEPTLQGAEIKHALVKYNGGRLAFQFEAASGSLRCPFGVDDGAKFNGKPSMNIELPPGQAAFQDKLEDLVKDAAVENKAVWFGSIKPPPSDETVREAFNSRVKTDDTGKYPPTLKVNVNLNKIKVLTSRRLANGKITKPQLATVDAVVRGARIVPVLRTAGGVWVSANAKKRTLEYGLVLEVFELLVIEENAADSSVNFGGVEVASEDEGANENGATAGA